MNHRGNPIEPDMKISSKDWEMKDMTQNEMRPLGCTVSLGAADHLTLQEDGKLVMSSNSSSTDSRWTVEYADL